MTADQPDPAMIEAWEKHSGLKSPPCCNFRAGWEARDQATCEWKYDGDSVFDTACGNSLYFEEEPHHTVPYCGGCGRRWVIKTEPTNQ